MAEERKSFAETTDNTGNAPVVDYEEKARESGWAPQEQFKGDPGKWIDAEQWVKRGESFIPFLQAANRDLKDKVGNLSSQLEETRRIQAATLKAIDELKQESTIQATTTLEEQKADLTNRIVAAVGEGETAVELALRDELADVNEKLRAAKQTKLSTVDGTRGTPTTNGQELVRDPRMQKFLSENPWFETDPVMAGAAVAAMGQLNNTDEGKAMTPEARFDKVARDIKKRFGMADNTRRQAPNKVEGGRMEGSTGGGGGGKSWDDLPAEARATCDSLSKRFIGRKDASGEVKYKDLASYRARYAADYFADDWGVKIQNQ
jgi:hypothetical protein